jgi:hypothetical protein
MSSGFHIEVYCDQQNRDGQRICGDVFLSKKIREEQRVILVLSDGMGHGVKANVLGTLTATMAQSFTLHHKDVNRIADIIMKTLPECSVRKMSYATFTIVDIDQDGMVQILEYDNPRCIIMRGNQVFDPNWQCVVLEGEKNNGKEILSCSFVAGKEDRIIFMSDGIVQAGMGKDESPFGWGHEAVEKFITDSIRQSPGISAQKLAGKILKRAVQADDMSPKDDTSCAVAYFREPRKLILCTGPPYEEKNDAVYAQQVKEYEGKKIICGATTADIIAREWGEEINDSFDFEDSDLPPVSYMNGTELITEGILTLGKVNDLLRDYKNNTRPGKGPADQIVRMLLESDEIFFLIGTRINIAHQDPTLPVDLEIRRTVVRRIARILEEKFLKEVKLEFL